MKSVGSSVVMVVFIVGCIFKSVGADEDWREIYQKSRNAIATVHAYGLDGEQISLGSGFFINGEGHLITNMHVLRGAYSAKIEIAQGQSDKNKKTYLIQSIIAQDVQSDLVIVVVKGDFTKDNVLLEEIRGNLHDEFVAKLSKLENEGKKEAVEKYKQEMEEDGPEYKRRLAEMLERARAKHQTPYIKLSEDLPDVAEKIIVIGAPEGLDHTVSSGLVSAIRRISLPSTKDGRGDNREIQVIQTDAAISPGSSGGPMLNSKGEVVGIATFQFREGQNLNFAISAAEALALKPLEKPIKMGEWDWGGEIENDEEAYSPMNPAELGQDWVVSFTRQKEAGKIWGRRGWVLLDALRHKHKSLLSGGSSRNVLMYSQPAVFPEGYYLYEGHLYSSIELSHINPELPTEIVQETPLTSSAKVKAVTNDNYFIIQFDQDLSWGIVNSNKLKPGDIQRMGDVITVNTHHFARTGRTYFITVDNAPLQKYYEYTIVSIEKEFPLEMVKIPDTVREEEYFWYVYCEGLEADLADGMIVSSSCPHCDNGFITCPLCRGEGFLEVYNNRVITKEDPQYQAIRGKIRRVKCPLRCNKGKIACPHCVLIERPKYREDVKDRYLQRWQTPVAPSSNLQPQDETGND